MQLLVVQPFAYNGAIFNVGDVVADSLFTTFKNDPSIFGIKVVQISAPVAGVDINE